MTEPPSGRTAAEEVLHQASQEILERERQRAERKAVGAPRRGQGAALIGLIVAIPVLLVVMLPNFTDWSWRSLFETRPPAGVAREEAQKALNSLVGEVEGFRKDYHELPESLAEVGLPSRGRWKYSVTGDGRYTLTGSMYGQSVSFESPISTQNR
jgi:hypothetical protein